MRDDEGDEIGPVALVGALISVFLAESSVYSNMKAKAQLFYKLKVSEQQQKQMKSLLDAVPDNVIICSKATERKPAKVIFANLKTTVFFGTDVVNYQAVRQKKSMLKAVKIDGVIPKPQRE